MKKTEIIRTLAASVMQAQNVQLLAELERVIMELLEADDEIEKLIRAVTTQVDTSQKYCTCENPEGYVESYGEMVKIGSGWTRTDADPLRCETCDKPVKCSMCDKSAVTVWANFIPVCAEHARPG